MSAWRYAMLTLIAASLAGVAWGRDAPLEMPEGMSSKAGLSSEEISKEIEYLVTMAPSFPARFGSKGERMKVYKRWSKALLAARRFAKENGDIEESHVMLAELYRLGHNMQVRETTLVAQEAIEEGLEKFPASESLHFSNAYFYLSLDYSYSSKAEEALMKLRELKGTDRDYEVEKGFVYLYLNNYDIPKAVVQIDKCLEIQEDDPMLLALRKGLVGGMKRKEQRGLK